MTALLTLRPVQPADQPFLIAVYASTRSEELALVPWTEEQKQAFLQAQATAQLQHYEAHYPAAQHLIILQGEVPVGRLWLDRKEERIHLLDLTILPEHRNRGIGATILEELQAEAAGSGKAITIYVESFNRSLALFERLGFHQADQTGAHVLLQWRPVS